MNTAPWTPEYERGRLDGLTVALSDPGEAQEELDQLLSQREWDAGVASGKYPAEPLPAAPQDDLPF